MDAVEIIVDGGITCKPHFDAELQDVRVTGACSWIILPLNRRFHRLAGQIIYGDVLCNAT